MSINYNYRQSDTNVGCFACDYADLDRTKNDAIVYCNLQDTIVDINFICDNYR